jgi:hypothetical protein
MHDGVGASGASPWTARCDGSIASVRDWPSASRIGVLPLAEAMPSSGGADSRTASRTRRRPLACPQLQRTPLDDGAKTQRPGGIAQALGATSTEHRSPLTSPVFGLALNRRSGTLVGSLQHESRRTARSATADSSITVARLRPSAVCLTADHAPCPTSRVWWSSSGSFQPVDHVPRGPSVAAVGVHHRASRRPAGYRRWVLGARTRAARRARGVRDDCPRGAVRMRQATATTPRGSPRRRRSRQIGCPPCPVAPRRPVPARPMPTPCAWLPRAPMPPVYRRCCLHCVTEYGRWAWCAQRGR